MGGITGRALVGMLGPELSEKGMELRRGYFDLNDRRQDVTHRDLSTSELQPAALGLHRNAGYELVREEVAETASNKTLGGGFRRFHF